MLGFLSSANASSAQSSSATSSSAQPAASEHVYTVQSGDSRQLILNKLGVGESQWNKLGDQATIHTKNGQEIPYSQAYVLKPGDQVVFKGALADKINGSKAPAEQKTANSTATPDTAAPAQAAAQTTPTTTNINQPPPGFGGGRWNNIPLDDRQAIWNDYNKSQQTAGAQGTTGTQSTPGTGQVDLSTMTQEQQYNYFKDLVESQGGTWKEGAEANIIGVRSLQDGKPVEGEGNVYDDTIFVCRMVDGEPQVESFTASTDAGAFDPIAAVTNADGTRKTDDKGNELSPYGGTDNDGDWGVSHLADGFYEDTWKIGDVPLDDKGLRQSGDIQVNFDNNYDGVISEDERDNQTKSSGWGIQFHPGGSGEHVNGYSAGCQVIKEQEYARFKEILTEQENAGQTAFSYLLIDSSNLPPTGESPPPTPGRNIPE
ncbi:MAG: hypothetical protein JXR83_08360 [Deltaproteobacteria bacterium]|nr:hypothetical protein [Deltaproteobacteria bacterium]